MDEKKFEESAKKFAENAADCSYFEKSPGSRQKKKPGKIQKRAYFVETRSRTKAASCAAMEERLFYIENSLKLFWVENKIHRLNHIKSKESKNH